MKNKILLEKKETSYLKSKDALSADLFCEDHIQVVGVGPTGCIRLLYFRGEEAGKLHQLQLILVSKQQYAMMNFLNKIHDALQKALSVPKTKGIILFVSCPDILMQTDFYKLLNSLDNPENIPINILNRGPLTKRLSPARPKLKSFLDSVITKIEQMEEVSPTVSLILPPLCPDTLVALYTLHQFCKKGLLLTPGGCGATLPQWDYFGDISYYQTRFDDTQTTLGLEKELISLFQSNFKKDIYIIPTQVPEIISTNYQLLERELSNLTFLKTNGFDSGIGILSSISLQYIQEISDKNVQVESINLLGYSPFIFGNSSLFEPLENLCNKYGITVYGLSPEQPIHPQASCNLLVSTEGIATANYLKEIYGTPLIEYLPIGITGWNHCIQAINRHFQKNIPLLEKSYMKPLHRDILIIGEPFVSNALADCFTKDFGVNSITIACYAPDKRTKQFYKKTIPNMNIQYCSTVEEIQKIINTHSFIVADPCYHYLTTNTPSWVSIPHPMLSGNIHLSPWSLFGENGYKYLQQQIGENEYETND